MLSKRRISIIIVIAFLAVISLVFIWCTTSSSSKSSKLSKVYIKNQGHAQGTTYSAIYLQPNGIDLQSKIDSTFREIDLSLSIYTPNSIISKINNNNDSVRTDHHFEYVFNTAAEISARTKGAFDITVGPLVKAWGFAFGNKNHNHNQLPVVADYLPIIGYKKVQLKNHRLLKDDQRILIDVNAIAQGYTADVMGQLLEKNGCSNYIFEIGGEIVCKGVNESGTMWKIGIDKPIDDSTGTVKELQSVLSLSNNAITTSGNYRKYYYKNGKKYAHHIDPRTGYPIVHNLLSVTVIAPKGIVADAYACSFMVLGMDSAMKIYKFIPGMECYFIYVDSNGNQNVKYTPGFKKFLSH
jgi:thiamine biosynthesis lipoprotein